MTEQLRSNGLFTAKPDNNPSSILSQSESDIELQPSLLPQNRTKPLTPEEKWLSRASDKLFHTRLRRSHPWILRNGVVSTIDKRPIGKLGKSRITREDLRGEKISKDLAKSIRVASYVESFLTDYTNTAGRLFRHLKGIDDGYKQWGNEELDHYNTQVVILEETGSEEKDVMDDEYEETRQNIWIPPYGTPRLMSAYGAPQEITTGDIYDVLGNEAEEQGAPHVAAEIYLIAGDEKYHCGGHIAFNELWAEQDQKGFEEDALRVAAEFQLPAQGFIPKPLASMRAVRRIGAFSSDVIVNSLHKLYSIYEKKGMISEGSAKKAVNLYVDSHKPKGQRLQKQG